MRWLMWYLVALHLFLLEGWVSGLWPLIDGGAVVCVFLVLHARPGAIPGLLLLTALARAVLVAGSLPVHCLAMGLPVALLLPLRGLLFRRQVIWHLLAALLVMVSVPRVALFVGGVAGREVFAVSLSGWEFCAAAALVPLLAWLLSRTPFLERFRESSE